MISTKAHGVIDYVTGLLLLASPLILEFPLGGAAQQLSTAFGIIVIIMSLLTSYELGVAKLIPFSEHLALDVGIGLILIASPWLFGFTVKPAALLMVIGTAGILVPLFTQHHMARHAYNE
jgi:hypothetical protein